jgi:hypothetical protein
MSESKDPMIAALLRERDGYVAFGKKDRIKDVDAELKRRGYEEPKKAEPKARASKQTVQTTADAPKKSTA